MSWLQIVCNQKTSKTAYQNEYIDTKNHSARHATDVWWLLQIHDHNNLSRTSTTTTTNHNSFCSKINNNKNYYHLHNYCHILYIMCIILIITNATNALPTTSSSSTSSLPATLTKNSNEIEFLLNDNNNKQTIQIIKADTIHTSSSSAAVVPKTYDATRLRKRHSKRHSNWYEHNNFNENSTELEWVNPCGGVYEPATAQQHIRRINLRKEYNDLKRKIGREYKMLKSHPQDIDISNIQMWFKHNYTYKFLPKLKINSSIAPKRWYRNMQTFVGAFAYLHRVQHKWDHAKSQRESAVTRELNYYLTSSRDMLCEFEATVNKTHPYRMNGKQFPHITRAQMNKRLKLRTKRRAERNLGGVLEADTVDLNFVKYYYLNFLDKAWKITRKNTKRKGQAALMQQPQQQQQSDFNEVGKQFGSIRQQQKGEQQQQQPIQSSGQNRNKSIKNNHHATKAASFNAAAPAEATKTTPTTTIQRDITRRRHRKQHQQQHQV